ncbi:hypothetical protein [Hahella ganghwensis]|uniref:hypothetical protein n=1 Tax=Hahella ganghwensis TaxID=286420 RepID=UPI00036352E1|nr:hypothetical protein [Hahella ganghwensis]
MNDKLNLGNEIENSIKHANHALEKRLQEIESLPAEGKSHKGIVMLLVSLLCLFLAWELNQTTASKIDQAIHQSSIDLILEADGEVSHHFRQTGSLPELLPDQALETLITYEKLDEENYRLSVTFSDNPQWVERNINDTVDITALSRREL